MGAEANPGGGYCASDMGRRGQQFACALVVTALAFPGAAFGQSAGDDQYEDPFAPTEEPAGGGAQEPEPQPDPAPAAPAPAAPAPAPAATSAQSPNGGAQLPRTGADEGWVALAGAVMLAAGIALRVRTR